MSDEEQLQTFVTNLGGLPTNMRIFSLSEITIFGECNGFIFRYGKEVEETS